MRWSVSSVLLMLPCWLGAQVPLDTNHYPRYKALFERAGNSKRLGCEVRPMQPHLNFGFHFVTGYIGHLPLKHYEGPGHRFAVVIKVTPDDTDREPTYLSQLFQIAAVPGHSRGEIEMDGAFFVGAGGYRVEWLIADREGETCRKSWHIEAKAPRRARELQSFLKDGAVAPLGYDPWPGSFGTASNPHRLTVYLHVTPLSTRRLKLHPYDQTMLLSSVLSLLQRSDFTSVKVVAFNLDQQKEIFRQDEFNEEGWRRLIEATGNLNLLTVPIGVLKKAGGHANMLREFIADELSAKQASDAVVFLGPTARQMEKLRFPNELATAKEGRRFYYFQYKPYWNRGAEYPDVLSHIMHKLGGKTFHIYSADDFFQAITEVKQALGPASPSVTQAP